jgi:protein phosphatase 1L
MSRNNNDEINDHVFFCSLKGRRDKNEDAHNIILNLDGKNKNMACVNYYGIYDGHSGSDVSKYLKNNLPKYFLDKTVKYPLNKKYVTDVFNAVQNDVSKYKFASHSGSTCLVVVQFKYNEDDYINVINLGDCRCVINRDGFAMPLTKDHKPNWPDEFNRITRLGGSIIFDGQDWRIQGLSVSKSIADNDAKPYIDHIPDLFRYKIDKCDKFLVLSCDGVYESLKTEEVINFVMMNGYNLETKKRIKTNFNIAKKLANYAIDKGSHDNVSICLVYFDDI